MTALTVVPVLVLPLLVVLQKLEHWAIDAPTRKKPRDQASDRGLLPVRIRRTGRIG